MDKDVMIVAFKGFLDKHDVLDVYTAEWSNVWSCEYDCRLVDWWGEYSCACWLSCAFAWCRSSRGYDYWCNLHKEWVGVCMANGWCHE